MLESYRILPHEVDAMDAEMIDHLDARLWAANQQKNVQKERDALRARMNARLGK